MPPRTVSRDLKERIPILHHIYGLKVPTICDILGVRKTLVYQTLTYHRLHGVPFNVFAQRPGRHRVLDMTDIRFLESLISTNPTIYLDEMQAELRSRRHLKISIPTLVRTLRRLDITRKVLSRRAAEHDDIRRATFMNCIGDLAPDPHMLIFMDESSRNDRTSHQRTGRSRRGIRCVQRQCFVRGTRYSLLPALTLDGIIAYDVFEGSVTSERFLAFLREQVVHRLYMPHISIVYLQYLS